MAFEGSLPPGFRFHPTDEELVVHYLKRKVSSSPLPVSIITDIDLYKFDPWDLPGKAKARFGEQEGEWYFFSPRERKYPNGGRPNRAAASGYWKATGTDKPIFCGTTKAGVKKALVFYKGRPPNGTKTGWIMHEYRLIDSALPAKPYSMRLDDWVLCRIYKKAAHSQGVEGEESCTDLPESQHQHQYQQQPLLNLPEASFSGLMPHQSAGNGNHGSSVVRVTVTDLSNSSPPPKYDFNSLQRSLSIDDDGVHPQNTNMPPASLLHPIQPNNHFQQLYPFPFSENNNFFSW
eukprot:Gb_02849 [translate_table: standard]